MSELSVGQLRGLTVNSNVITVPSGHTLYAPGAIVQVVQAVKTDTFSTSATTYTDVTGLSATITPRFASSKIMVFYSMMLSQNTTGYAQVRLDRAGTAISIGDSAGTRDRVTMSSWTGGANNYMTVSAGMFLDSPNTTSATIYKLQLRSTEGLQYVNRNARDSDITAEPRGVSSITLMEIAQ
jgi:hypothetical protein